MKPGKTTEASDLSIRIADEFMAHDYLEDGVWEFLKRLQPDELTKKSMVNHFVLTAEMQDEIVGTIEIRENNHISFFCVEKQYRRRGIGRKLLRSALELCLKYDPQLCEVSVNSLPGAVYIYERLGFYPEKSDRMEGDTPYTPMFLHFFNKNIKYQNQA